MEEESKPNYYIRILIGVLAAFIVWLISYSFLTLKGLEGQISVGIITLVFVLVVLVLSESFDNFSIWKLLSLSRDNKKKELSISKLNFENIELRKELVNVVTSMSQNQTSLNINGVPDVLLKKMFVERASGDEITEKRSEETEENDVNLDMPKFTRRRVSHKDVEDIVFPKFLLKFELSDNNLIKEVKLLTQFSGIDALSNIQPVFDGYFQKKGLFSPSNTLNPLSHF